MIPHGSEPNAAGIAVLTTCPVRAVGDADRTATPDDQHVDASPYCRILTISAAEEQIYLFSEDVGPHLRLWIPLHVEKERRALSLPPHRDRHGTADVVRCPRVTLLRVIAVFGSGGRRAHVVK